MPSNVMLKAMNAAHRALLKVSGNRLGTDFGGMPALELTTIGRKSGQPRSVMLTAPLTEGDALVVVASRGGDDVHPAWFLNLRENPSVQVALPGQARRPMHARIADPDQRARMWPQIADKHRNYAGYQRRTTREIPLVLLEPVN
ncbi:MAG: nitroreductase/quinone reductase family protein [Jatrophihabitantaceae bacterium]